MANVQTNGYGTLVYNNRDLEGTDKVIAILTGKAQAELTRWELFQFIEGLVNMSGMGALVNEASGEITILKPESPAVSKRKDKLAMEFYGVKFSLLDLQGTRNVEYIISLEKKLGAIE